VNSADDAVISIRNLKMLYGDKLVLKGINLDVRRGQIIGYIGPNGAGKSTTIKAMLGLAAGYMGEIRIFGRDISDGDVEYKRRIGYVPETAEIYDALTAREYLTFIGCLYGLDEAQADRKAQALMRTFDLAAVYDARLASYSKGMRQRVLLISSLLHNPDILFLDEPLSGLDANSVMVVKDILVRLATQGKTIFYSSHIMDVVEKVSNRIILLDGGQIVADGSFAELQERLNERSLEEIFNIQLMPAFERKLHKLSSNSAGGGMKKRSWLQAMSRIVCANNEERAFFRFASVMMAREREFKLKVYPALGFAMVFPFIFIFNPAWSSGLKDLASSRWYLSIYLSALMIPSVVMMLKYSAQYKAAWVYKTAPVQSAAAIFKGTIKAFLMRLFLPIYLVESVIFVAIFGIRIIPDLIVACLSMLLYAVICFRFTRKSLPFSEPFQAVQESQRYVALLLLLFIGAFAAVHFVFSLIPFGVYIYMFLLALLNGAVWRAGVGFHSEHADAAYM